MSLAGGLPRSMTERRLREVLGLSQNQVNRLVSALKEVAPGAWPEEEYAHRDFVEALFNSVATAKGLDAYQAAARAVEASIPKWRLGIDVRAPLGLVSRYLDDAEFRALYPDGEPSEVSPGDVEDIAAFLVKREAWPDLAELVWANAVATGDAGSIHRQVAAHPQLAEELRDILAALDKVGTAAESPGGDEPAADEGGENEAAGALLRSLRTRVRGLHPEALTVAAIDEVASELAELRELTHKLLSQRETMALLDKFNGIVTDFGAKFEELGFAAEIERWRVTIADPARRPAGTTQWMEQLLASVARIAKHDAEIRDVMAEIASAAGAGNLDQVQSHTARAQEAKSARETALEELRRHLAAG